MNVDILTIGNMLSRPVTLNAEPRSDAWAEKGRFSPVRENSEQPSDVTRAEKPDQARAETPNDSAPQGGRDFREAIDKRTKSDESEHTNSRCETKSQNIEPKASDPPEATQNVVVEIPDSTDQNKEKSAQKNASDSRQQVAGAIDLQKGKKTQPDSSKALDLKLNSNKATQTSKTETAATEKLENAPVDASNEKTGNSESSKTLHKTATKPTNVSNEDNAKELSAAAKTANDAKPADRGITPPVTEKSSETAHAKVPAKDTEYSTNQKADNNTGKSESIAQTKTAQVKTSQPTINTGSASNTRQTPSESNANNAEKAASTSAVPPKEQEKSLSTAEGDSDLAATQTPKKQIRPLGSKTVNDGNNTENAASKTTESRTATPRAQSGNSRSSGDSLNENSAQIFTKNTVQTPVTEQTGTFGVETKATSFSEQPQPTPGNGQQKVGSQVLEAVRNSVSQQPTGDKEITIQLNPPELGKVSVKFLEHGAEITGTLEVSKAQTRAEIEQALPEMIRSLADSGIAIKRLEVVLSQNEQPDQQSTKAPLPQDGRFQQQNSADPGQSGEQKQTTPTAYNPTSRSRYQYQTGTYTHEMLLTNNTINMLV